VSDLIQSNLILQFRFRFPFSLGTGYRNLKKVRGTLADLVKTMMQQENENKKTLLSSLLNSESAEGDDPLTTEEIIGNCLIFMLGGQVSLRGCNYVVLDAMVRCI